MSVKPITPQEIPARKTESLPDVVIEAINALIVANFRDGRATFSLSEAHAALRRAGLTRGQISHHGYLDFEPAYRDAGWRVTYDPVGIYTFEVPA